MVTGRTLINAIIGAVVGVVLSFIPFSTVVGGLVAGFLEGPDERRGAIVGALAGIITFLPIAAGAVLVLGFLGFGFGVAAVPIEGFAIVMLFVFVGAALVFLYTVGLSLLGGYLGAYLAREYPEQRARTRDTVGLSPDRPGSVDPTRPPRASEPASERESEFGAGTSWEHDPEEDSTFPDDDSRARDRDADRDRERT
ncbi:DUF5518 domain-containing protein [Halosolutus gelatinilyticus]|uniref:DUF5518 domain-containing protein n=1 Tax=Halosolutus gelatinilyticus TaxID=2931975 RepID=UPI001FF3C3D1|nr:DUF5518 domain-containing protein [Halosolutus gelatinilyticus]